MVEIVTEDDLCARDRVLGDEGDGDGVLVVCAGWVGEVWGGARGIAGEACG